MDIMSNVLLGYYITSYIEDEISFVINNRIVVSLSVALYY